MAPKWKSLRIAILSTEAVPFAKTGGLGDVAGALPGALTEQGAFAFLILPLYDQVDRSLLDKVLFENFDLEWRGGTYRIRVWQSDKIGAPTLFIEAPEYFGRPKIYGYPDDHTRFAFYSRAALSLIRAVGEPPDIIHCNDWPCGFAASELRARRRFDPYFSKTRTVFSIHNLAYQGAFDPNDLWWLGVDDRDRGDFMLNGVASALKAGLMTSDALSTVSRRYSFEIQMREQGHGLDWLLRMRHERLVGITNGIDYKAWNPETDAHTAAHFNAEDLSGKRECKLDLLRRFGLPEDARRPVIAIISRLVAQKGYDLIQQAIGGILSTGAFFIALGTGAKEYENFLQALHDHAPQQVGVYLGYAGEPLAHQIEAGADIFLMPSLYEPCGLNQMYSMRYGTVPVVRATGGLDDTVENFDAARGTGNGFKFEHYSAGALLDKIREALYFYTQPEIWKRIQVNGMRVDNSWEAAAQKYLELYRAVIAL